MDIVKNIGSGLGGVLGGGGEFIDEYLTRVVLNNSLPLATSLRRCRRVGDDCRHQAQAATGQRGRLKIRADANEKDFHITNLGRGMIKTKSDTTQRQQ
ncbi:hypothetical protein EVAR_101987_1 [Eumeta japonica]|uniref:Uncharacterized protein n=1 Tax=Eumeta variegata TaxID=151549 RepID=A0A4C1TSI6_EUMVA|nr:hypothetical protein EVAR_101987_1 [Eumeta japonica]